MVQADASRNYYADLGVNANADENEIRKAFRQLALKYHPDRNPGREAEFVTKFQQIQSAHEILSDPTQRTKYDNERRKYRGLNIPPYNPNTPRARPPGPQRSAYTTTPSGSYYRAPPPRPTPQRPPPPQQHSTYHNGADRFTSRNFRPPPTAQRPKDADAKANVFTAWQKMKQHRGEETSTQNPNTTHNGHPNNPNGTPFGRNQNTRTPPARKGFNPATPGADEGQARSSYRSNFERPIPEPVDPLKHFKEQVGGEYVPHVPYSEGNRMRTPYSSAAAGERTAMYGEGLGRSASMRHPPTNGPGIPSEHGSNSDSGHRGQRKSFAGHGSKAFPQMYSDSSDESEADIFRSSNHSSRSDQPPRAPPPPQQSTSGQGPFGTASQGATYPSKPNGNPTAFKSRSEESINLKFSPSDWHGKFEGNHDYFAPHVPKGSSSKGRTSPTRGRTPQRSTTERGSFAGQSQPPPLATPGHQPPLSQMPPPPPMSQMPPPPPLSHMPPPPSHPPPNSQSTFPSATTSTQHSSKFTKEAWAETFKEPSWAFPQKDTSPRRGSTTTKRPKPVTRKASAPPNDANIDTQQESTKSKYQASAEDATTGSNDDGDADADAMEIDSTTPPVTTPKPVAPGVDKRYKAGTPIKFGTGTSTVPSSPLEQGAKTTSRTMPDGPATAPSSATKSRKSSGLDGLAGLKNVEPFLPSTNGGGISGLTDLGDSLPFPSKASSAHPTKPNTAQKLSYPKVPTAPQQPSQLDEGSVGKYLKKMEQYVKEYHDFSKTMTKHFAAREYECETLDENFISKRGETTKKLGFSSYLRKMKEDQGAMETWKIAQEMHIKAMTQCEEIRNKTMKSYGIKSS